MTELEVVHRFTVLCADADLVGLKLSANQLQFLLREHRTQQVYESCPTLGHVDEALRRRRQEQNAPGGQTRGLQSTLQQWARHARDIVEVEKTRCAGCGKLAAEGCDARCPLGGPTGDVWQSTFDAGHSS